MPANFYTRLRDYYLKVAEVLRGDAAAASIFPNSTDVGGARERIYADFLRQNAPSKCNVFLGGFLFDIDGIESKQLDVIVTTDTAPRFDFHNRDGGGKAFSPVEGTLGVASIKSNLDKAQLYDALDGIASIPPTRTLEDRIPPTVNIADYDDWPYKVVYATNGLTPETILAHLIEYYRQNLHVPICRRPDIIHVTGKYVIVREHQNTFRLRDRTTGSVLEAVDGRFHVITSDPDLEAIGQVLFALQERALASTHILYQFAELFNRVKRAP